MVLICSMQTLLMLLQQLQLHCEVLYSNEQTLCPTAFVMFLHSLQLQIQNDVLEFPADVAMSPGLKRLLSGMMIKDPAKRMRLEQVRNRCFNRYFCNCCFRRDDVVVQACAHEQGAVPLQHAKVH
jgi:hypothetical protein